VINPPHNHPIKKQVRYHGSHLLCFIAKALRIIRLDSVDIGTIAGTGVWRCQLYPVITSGQTKTIDIYRNTSAVIQRGIGGWNNAVIIFWREAITRYTSVVTCV